MSRLRRACVCRTSGAAAGHALITGSRSREHYYMVEFRHRTVATVASETAVSSARSRVFPADEGTRSFVTTALWQLLLRSYSLYFFVCTIKNDCEVVLLPPSGNLASEYFPRFQESIGG